MTDTVIHNVLMMHLNVKKRIYVTSVAWDEEQNIKSTAQKCPIQSLCEVREPKVMVALLDDEYLGPHLAP